MELRTIQDWTVRNRLLRTDGVADISSFGGFVKEYQAKVNPRLLRATNVTMEELFEALENGNSNTGGAYIEKDATALLIRGIGLANSLDDIRNTIIKLNRNIPVFVKDVADVSYGSTVRYGAMTMNGTGEVVGGVVLMRKGENASRVVANVKEKIEEIKKFLPAGLTIEPFIDRDELVARSIKTIFTNLFEAFIIVVFVLLIFLGDIRASLLVASIIPLSMLFAIILMNYFGVGGNLMSLGAIDFGLMVDPSIIVVEGVVVSLMLAVRKHKTGKLTLQDRQEIVYDASISVKKSVVFGGLIILVVYFPILTLTGYEGKMFAPMAMTVSFAITGAILLALTYIPVMCTLIIKPHGTSDNLSDKFMNFIFRMYTPLLHGAIRHQFLVVLAATVLFISAYFVFGELGGEFIPKLDEGDYNIETRLPVGTSLTRSKEFTLKVEKIIKETYPDEIENVVAKIGTSEIPTDPMPLEAMDFVISLKDQKNWTKVHEKADLTDGISKILESFPGVTFSIMQPIENRFNDMLSGAKTDVVIKIFGDDLNILSKKGDEIASILRPLEGARDVQVQKVGGLPQIIVKYDRRILASYGIPMSDVNRVVQTAFAGGKAGIIYDGEKRFDLTIRLASEDRNSVEDLGSLLVQDKNKNLIPLKELAEISIEKGPAEISRENGQRRLNVGFNVRGRDVESIVNEAQTLINKKIVLPDGYYLDYGGQFENLQRAKARLAVVVPLSLLIIFVLLFITFGRVKESLIIYAAIPLSAVGGVYALWIRDMALSISAGIGFIALFGIAVLNGILLIGEFKTLKDEHEIDDVYRRVLTGIKERFRQVLMTSATAALGFIPMAVSHSAGAEVQKPLATVVIGGLVTSTALTLIVLPVIYIIFSKKNEDDDD